MFKCGRFEASYLILWVEIYAKMLQVYYTSRNLLSRFISFAITPAKLKGGGFLHHSPLFLHEHLYSHCAVLVILPGLTKRAVVLYVVHQNVPHFSPMAMMAASRFMKGKKLSSSTTE